MKTAVVYTRVSSEEQVAGTSLATQLSDCTAYAQRSGFVVVNVFTDAGVSAKTTDRPALRAAVDYCAKNGVGALVVWKLDRLSRNTADGLILCAQLRKAGTDVLSATEGISNDATGQLVSTLLLSVAQFDNQQRAVRCRRGMEETALRGGWVHKPPVGFTSAKNADGLPVLSWDNPVGRTLAQALRGLADGTVSKSQYYDTCEHVGIPRSIAAKIPHKEIYAGIVCEALTGGQPVRAAFDGMITEEQRQRILHARRKMKACPAARTDYAGLLFCQECGSQLTPYLVKGKYVYYKCRNGHVSARDIGVHAQLQQIVASAPMLADILEKAVALVRQRAREQIDTHRAEREAIEAAAKNAQRRLDALTDKLVDGAIDDDTFHRKSAEYRAIIQRSNSARTDAALTGNAMLTGFEQTLEKLRNPKTLLAALSPEARRKVLTVLFGRFTVDRQKTVRACSNSAEPCLASALGLEYQPHKTETATADAATDDSVVLWWTKTPKSLTLRRLEAVRGLCGELMRWVG